jgi:hypothetical protein
MQQQPYGQPPPPQGGYPQPGYGYGQPQPPKKGMGPGTIALIVIACMFGGCMVIGAIGAATNKNQAQTTAATTTAATPTAEPKAAPTPTVTATPKPQAVPVTATQLFNDYQGNEVAADDKYKGKTLLVTGTISDVKKDFTDSIVIGLRTSNQFMPIDAHVDDSEKSKAARLNKGDSVKLQCEGNGMVIGRPQLGDCTLP